MLVEMVIHAVMFRFVGFTMLCLPCNDPDYRQILSKKIVWEFGKS